MAKLFPISCTSRGATLGLLLAASALTTAAYADDEYGTGGEAAIRQAAVSAPASPLSSAETAALFEWFSVGDNDMFGASRTLRLAPVIAIHASRLASTMPMVSGAADVVGGGGHQDELAREIHHPGSGTSW
jgi:hypothetical protein